MEKKIIWTDHAKQDLRSIYEFNIPIAGEEKSFHLVEELFALTETLNNEITGSKRYLSDLQPELDYQKLIRGNHIIIFRETEEIIYINRIFDSRQDPSKLRI